MTFIQAVEKKFGKGILAKLLLSTRIKHIFRQFAHEYEKSLSAEEKASFRRVFGE